MTGINDREAAAQAFRDLADKLKAFPALACSCRTLAGATEEYNEVELGREIAEYGRGRRLALKRLAARLHKSVNVLDIPIDPKAKLRCSESGVMSLMFDDFDAAAALAFAYDLEIDGGDVVTIGHCDTADLPIPYRNAALQKEWTRLAYAWEREGYDAWVSRVRQDSFERSQMGPL